MQFSLTKTVKALLIANFIIFLIQHITDQFFGGNFIGIFGLVPSHVVGDFWIWQLASYSFLHGDVMHFFLNMLMFLFVGSEIETTWGQARFLKYYFFCVISAGVAYVLMQLLITGGVSTPMVGASGGIFGLLTAYGILFGERTLLFMLLFPMKAKHFIWVLAGVQMMTLVFSPAGRLSSLAHLVGMGAGFAYLWGVTLIRIRMKKGEMSQIFKKKRKKSSHLQLVVNDEDDERDPEDTWH